MSSENKKNQIFLSKRLSVEIQKFQNGYLLWFSGPQATVFRYWSGINLSYRLRLLNLTQHGLNLIFQDPLTRYNFYNVLKKVDKSQKKRWYSFYRNQLRQIIINTQIGARHFLSVRGVGYKLMPAGTHLKIQVGLSHKTNIWCISGLKVQNNRKFTRLKFTHWNEQVLLNLTSMLRQIKKPEVYKGKGLRYKNEKVLRKEGKKKKTF